jgi:hypothetical protein
MSDTNKRIDDFMKATNKRIDDALRDEQQKLGVDVGFLQTVKGNITYDHSSTLGMTSSDKLQYAKMWFESKKNDIDTLKEISTESQKSFLKTLDEQMEIGRKELDNMEKEIGNSG